MPSLNEIIPDPEVLIALEPEELGLRMLPALARWPAWQGLLSARTFTEKHARPNAPGQGTAIGGPYPPQFRAEIGQAIREAWQWLVGSALLLPSPTHESAYVLSRRAEQIARAEDPVRAHAPATLRKDALNASIRDDVWSLFQRGKYDTAVFEAMKAVEIGVRAAARASNELVGIKLMRMAFHPEHGPLTDLTVDSGERFARSELFSGVIGSYKNPQSHRHVALSDPNEAAELILLANHLLRIVAEREAAISRTDA